MLRLVSQGLHACVNHLFSKNVRRALCNHDKSRLCIQQCRSQRSGWVEGGAAEAVHNGFPEVSKKSRKAFACVLSPSRSLPRQFPELLEAIGRS